MASLKQNIQQAIEKRWYSAAGALLFLLPLEWLFSWLAKHHQRKHQTNAYLSSIPTVVVGNISVGGTGKTPAIIALIKQLHQQGLKVGVVSRGYGRQIEKSVEAQGETAIFVNEQSTASQVGDEPLLIFQSCALSSIATSVVVCRSRVNAVKAIEQQGRCDVILCDDGMQHYQLGRHKELALIDGFRWLGNEHQLPVGPLREPKQRLSSVDWVVINRGGEDSLQNDAVGDTDKFASIKQLNAKCHQARVLPVSVTRIYDGEVFPLDFLSEVSSWLAVAGLGNPEKFFKTLETLKLNRSEESSFDKEAVSEGEPQSRFISRAFPDHHDFDVTDFMFPGDVAEKGSSQNHSVIMTSKDAVKCRAFAQENWYQLDVEMVFSDEFLENFHRDILALINSKTSQ